MHTPPHVQEHIHYRTTKPTTHINLDIRNDHMQKPPYLQPAEHTIKMRPHFTNCESNNQCARSRSITYKSAEYHHHNPMHSKCLMQAHLHIHLHSTLLSINQIHSAGYMATLESGKMLHIVTTITMSHHHYKSTSSSIPETEKREREKGKKRTEKEKERERTCKCTFHGI
ncbi:hypothetical protein BDD12DRAFT_802271 [Trichophaea hybrida]|nr:hypothetical protein BDD12DRAFT_802271 [Trichophaea hybrida]